MNKREIVCYNTDASRLIGRAEKVFFPKNINEIIEMLKNTNLDIVPRGAGTGIVGGCIPNNSIVVDLCEMNKILDFNSKKRIVKVEAGISIKELNEKLRTAGFEFPIYSMNYRTATIGGMTAMNASGNRSMKYGTMKDWIGEIQFVNGAGELVKTTKADILDVCGMEGITGIIVNVILKILPLIERSASIFQTDNLDEMFSVSRRLKSDKDVVMLKLFSKQVSKLLGFPEKYNLIIEFDSDRGKIKGEEYLDIIKKSDDAYKLLLSEGYYHSEDPKLFFDLMKEFIVFLEINDIPYFGDLGMGIIYPFFKDEENAKIKETLNIIRKIKAKLGKYGFGIKRKDFLDSFEIKLIQRVKQRHDSSSRFNNGKLIDMDSIMSHNVYELRKEIKQESLKIKPFSGEEKSAVEFIEGLEHEIKKQEEIKEEIKKGAEDETKEEISREKTDNKIEQKAKSNIDYKSIQNIMTNKHNSDKTSGKSTGNNKEKKSDNSLIKNIMTDNFRGEDNSEEQTGDAKEHDA